MDFIYWSVCMRLWDGIKGMDGGNRYISQLLALLAIRVYKNLVKIQIFIIVFWVQIKTVLFIIFCDVVL